MTTGTRYVSAFSGSVSERRLTEFASRPLPVISPVARILLTCARENLDLEQSAHVAALCSEVQDWDAFVAQAEFRLIVPLVYRHMSQLPAGAVPEEVLVRLKDIARQAVMRNLAMIAIHHRLVREVLEPLDVSYLFFKGPSLAYRYYRDSALRQFRDIDVLIPRRDMVRIGKRLRETGLISYPDPLWASDDGLKFRQRFLGVMDWVSPQGVLIEMPSSLDDWARLPTDEMIARAERVNIGELEVPVVSAEDFFCYMCKHHSRHHWARLHWIADLNTILAHPEFDVNRIRAGAARRGFERTVEAAIAIHAAVSKSEPWKASFTDPFARELFRHCLMNLDGDFQQELALRKSFPVTDIDIAPARRLHRHFVSRNLNRFRPHGLEFLQCPLPAKWHWVYYLLRPFLWTARKLGVRQPVTGTERTGHDG